MKKRIKELIKEWNETAKAHREKVGEMSPRNFQPHNLLMSATMAGIYEDCASQLKEALEEGK